MLYADLCLAGHYSDATVVSTDSETCPPCNAGNVCWTDLTVSPAGTVDKDTDACPTGHFCDPLAPSAQFYLPTPCEAGYEPLAGTGHDTSTSAC